MTHILLSLIRLGLRTSPVDDELETLLPLTISQWREVMAMADRQHVFAIAFDGVQSLFNKCQKEIRAVRESPKEWGQWVFDCIGVMTHYEQLSNQQKRVIVELSDIWDAEGISMMVFKGQAISLFYPQRNHRASGDIDCWLFGEAERGDSIMKRYGAIVNFKWYRHSKITFHGELIENHRVIGHTRGGKKRKWMNAEFQAMAQSQELSVLYGCGKALRPSAQFNACFLTYHGINHFISEGLRMKQVLDWAMFLEKEQKKVDWLAFNDFCERFKLDRFAALMNFIAVKYLGVKCIPEINISLGMLNINELADKVLRSTLYDDDYLFNSGKGNWTKRWLLIKNMFIRDRWKYRDVAQINIWSQLWLDSTGFLFEKDKILE